MALSNGRACKIFSGNIDTITGVCTSKVIIKTSIIYALVINTVVCPIAMDDIIKIKDPSCDELIYKGILY